MTGEASLQNVSGQAKIRIKLGKVEGSAPEPVQKRMEKGKPKVRAMTTMRDGVRVDRQRATSLTPVVVVVETIRRATMYASRMEARKVRKGGKEKGVTLVKGKVTTANQERVAGSARDSAEPGAVATLGHPKE